MYEWVYYLHCIPLSTRPAFGEYVIAMHVLFLFQVAFHIATLLLLSLPGIWSLPLNSTPEELQFSKLDEIARSIHQKRDTIVENNCANTANKSWGNSTKKALREASEMVSLPLPVQDYSSNIKADGLCSSTIAGTLEDP